MLTKITDGRKNTKGKLINELPYGRMFLFNGSIYVKLNDDVEDCDDNETCALNLMNEEIDYFSLSCRYDDTVEFEIIIKNRH